MQKILKSGIWGAIASIIFTTVITIWGELHAPLKSWLAGTFSHHWLGKSILSVAVFIAIGFIAYFFQRVSETDENDRTANLIRLLTIITAVATVAFIGFYLYESR